MFGLINGYDKIQDGNAFPVAVPVVQWQGGSLGTNLLIMPPIHGKLHGGLGLQIKLRF